MVGKKQIKPTKNYRGSFEGNGDDWRMQADRKHRVIGRTSNMNTFIATLFSAAAMKFWIAFVGFIITTITAMTGIDVTLLFGITPESVIAFVTAILVYAIPNAENPVVTVT